MSLAKRILRLIFGKEPMPKERRQIQDIDYFPNPKWVMFVPVLSTAHIRKSDNILMKEWGDLSMVVPMEHGFLVYVGEYEENWDEYPKAVRELCQWAHKRNYPWIRIDRDGDKISPLTLYEW